MSSGPGEVTRLLRELRSGDEAARAQLAEVIYLELRRLASARMNRERKGHTLSPTALAHEAWIRLSTGSEDFHNRAHFFSVAAVAMRRLLIDHARAKLAHKRGGGLLVSGDDFDVSMPEPEGWLLDLHEALDGLEKENSRAARVVELSYFAGLSHDEIATILGLTRRTVDRDWQFARAWLFQKMRSA